MRTFHGRRKKKKKRQFKKALAFYTSTYAAFYVRVKYRQTRVNKSEYEVIPNVKLIFLMWARRVQGLMKLGAEKYIS